MSTIQTVKTQIQSLIDLANETTGNQDTNLTDGVNALVEGFGQGGSGGSASLNIHYGDTEPTDTSMLWCKCNEPTSVIASPNIQLGSKEIINDIGVYTTQKPAICVVQCDTKIYFFGGKDINTISVFDTVSNNIETLTTTMPVSGLRYAKGVSVGTKIYIFGGMDSSGSGVNTIYVFDTETNNIETLSATVGAYYFIGVTAVGTKIYILGGSTGSGNTNEIYKFHTETNTVEKLSAKLPQVVSRHMVATIGTKIYLIGGYNGSATLNTIYVFDTENYTIEMLSTTLPAVLSHAGVCVVGTKIYLIGGYNGGNAVNTIYIFDTETNNIETSTIKLIEEMCLNSACFVGMNIYILNGIKKPQMTDSYVKTYISVLSLSADLSYNTLYLLTSMTENLFDIFKGYLQMEMGVKSVYIGNSDGQGELVEAYLYQNEAWTQI